MNTTVLSERPRSSIVAVAIAASLALASSETATAGPITFSTFVTTANLNATEGQSNTIAFNFAGNKFIGSVYFGPNNLQLYSTDLTGGNVQKFGSPIPSSFAGEVVVAASLGQAGFAKGDIYAGAGDQIFHYANSGGSPTLFATVGDFSDVRQVFFDPGSSFGGNMLVTTAGGHIYSINSSGAATLLASIGEDTEGLDIATSAWGSFAGDLLVASEGSGTIRLVSPSGNVTPIGTVGGAETVSFVPLNLNAANSLEGFYVANYPDNVQFAGASQFTSLLGDAIVTSEFFKPDVYDVHYNGGTSFTITSIGTLPNQSEDGIFVSGQRLSDLGAPEPASLLLLGQGAAAVMGLAWRRRRKLRTAAA